jgi:response regulator NasT
MNANVKAQHILLVEDDRLVLASLSRALQQSGYRVTEAGNGEDAYALAERLGPDLALLDVRMPGMSGIELGRFGGCTLNAG